MLEQMPPARILHGDKGYDSNAIRVRSRRTARCPTSRPRPTALEELLLARPLPRPKRHRAHVLPPQGFPPRRHTIRPQRRQLPRRRLHRRNRQLLVMSPDPRRPPSSGLLSPPSPPSQNPTSSRAGAFGRNPGHGRPRSPTPGARGSLSYRTGGVRWSRRSIGNPASRLT